jgi:hypothetical protein
MRRITRAAFVGVFLLVALAGTLNTTTSGSDPAGVRASAPSHLSVQTAGIRWTRNLPVKPAGIRW